MSTSDSDPIVESGPPTGELPVNTTAEIPATPTLDASIPPSDLDSLFQGEQDDWPNRGPAKGFRVPWPMAVLLVLLVASVGIWGGAYMQRHSSSSSTTAGASAFSSFASRFRTAGAGGSTPSAAAGSSDITAGTVTDIIGNTLYVTTSTGSLVAVDVGSTTTVDRNAKSSLSALKPGDTVTVQGTKGSNGSVTAASVSATQAGVTAVGGFGGRGFGGAGAGGFGG
jgi:Cu/Ag efflux protein CusF